MRRFSQTPLALAISIAAGCARNDTQIEIQYAPGFVHDGSPISVFGVFKDGRLTADGWDELRPKLAAALGKTECQPVYGNELSKANPALSAATGEYAEANGVTDELLTRFAPMARGKLIMTMTIAGQVRPEGAATTSEPPKVAAIGGNMGTRRGGGGRGRRRAQAPGSPKTAEPSALEVSATLFSVPLGHAVSLLSMTYTGSSLDDAFRQFAEKLAAMIPGSTCAGWNWAFQVDEAKIREMAEH